MTGKRDILSSAAMLNALIPVVDRIAEGDSPAGLLPLPDLTLPANIKFFVRNSASILVHPPLMNSVTHVLALVVKGTGSIVVDGMSFRMRPRNAVLVFPRQVHFYTRLPRKKFSWLFITFELQRDDLIANLRSKLLQLDAVTLAGVNRLAGIYTHSSPRDPVSCARVSLGLLQSLLDMRTVRQSSGTESAGDTSLTDKMVCATIRYISENLDQRLLVRDIARELGVSVSGLQTAFRQTIKMSLGAYIRRTRIYRAYGLIQNPTLTLKEIAAQTGFSSLQTFSRACHQSWHCAPRELRRRLGIASE